MFNGVVLPYVVVRPYSTWESLASSVVQVMFAPVAVIPDAATVEMRGGVVSPPGMEYVTCRYGRRLAVGCSVLAKKR